MKCDRERYTKWPLRIKILKWAVRNKNPSTNRRQQHRSHLGCRMATEGYMSSAPAIPLLRIPSKQWTSFGKQCSAVQLAGQQHRMQRRWGNSAAPCHFVSWCCLAESLPAEWFGNSKFSRSISAWWELVVRWRVIDSCVLHQLRNFFWTVSARGFGTSPLSFKPLLCFCLSVNQCRYHSFNRHSWLAWPNVWVFIMTKPSLLTATGVNL